MNYGNCKEENNRGGCPVDIMSGKPDLTLVEVDDPDLARYDLYLSGWNRQSPAPTDSAVAIHHPQGDAKRITFEYDPATITYLTRSSSRDDTHITVEWDAGTTEGGSSGGPLFTGSQRIVGVLSAGGRGCEIQDWFGRIALGFENGNYTPDGFQRPATLADWLDPTDSGTQTLDGRNLAADSIPPARASNFRVAEVTPDSVTLRWEAPGNDRMTGTADRYLLRYQVNTPIRSRSDFEQSTPVSTVPSPKSAGTSQSATVGVSPDSSYYFALVAQDEVRNASPLAVTDRDVTPTPGLRVVTPPAPNPARSQSRVSFAVREEQPVRVTLYDPLGRRLRVLRDETVRPFRRQTVQVDLSSLSSGVYFLRIRGQRAARTARIAVVK
jgi:lysyl endopeptidase